jgi:hypothetical protein
MVDRSLNCVVIGMSTEIGCLIVKKEDNVSTKTGNFGVWCEHCSIRIAPNEGRVAVKNKTYHERCYAKSKTLAGAEK